MFGVYLAKSNILSTKIFYIVIVYNVRLYILYYTYKLRKRENNRLETTLRRHDSIT